MSYDQYDNRVAAEAAVFRAMRERVQVCFDEGMTEEPRFQEAIEYMGARIWREAVTRRLIFNFWFEEKRRREGEARRKAEAERKAAAAAEALANPAPEPAPKVKTPRKKSTVKAAGKFKARRLTKYPDYTITENARVAGPAGTELKYRWNAAKPYVKIEGKDRSVYWLMVMAGFEEHPADKKARRAAAKKALPYNDLDEAKSEDPEAFGLDPETGEAVM